ncbi:MAG TPA: WG repeat-containing protein [Sediminibacterium sp.]|nr:WG repeat-containing protein [Sediminibacterium sp.]
MDKTGKYIINPQFEQLVRDGNLFVVRSGGKFGWADKEGKFVINPQFEATYGFAGSKMAAVMSGRSWGYVDKEGKYIINPQFSYASPFNGSVAVVSNGSQVGIIDKEGKYLVNPQFSGVSSDYAGALIGKSTTGTVVSDFVDIGSAINKLHGEITDKTVAGFSFASKVGEIIQKFSKTPANYSYSNRNVYLFEREQISPGIKLSLEIGGIIFISRGWNYELNPEAYPDQFQYRIDLEGKAISKVKDLMQGLKNAFAGYTLTSGDNSDIEMSNSYQKISIADRESAIYVEITKLN